MEQHQIRYAGVPDIPSKPIDICSEIFNTINVQIWVCNMLVDTDIEPWRNNEPYSFGNGLKISVLYVTTGL